MNQKILLLVICGFLILDNFAQVSKTVVAEHFTNTYCGLCASRNPNLWARLDDPNNADVLHVSYHPSAPYDECDLNKFDVTANDDRVIYYGEYGATPKLMVNGTDLIVGSNFSNVNLFNAYLAETTPIEINFDANSNAEKTEISLTITVKNAIDHQLDDLVLFAGLAEEQVDFSANNGENEHHNVFRQAFTALEGDPVAIDGNAGSEFEFNYTIELNSALSPQDLFAYVILQKNSNYEVIQAAKSATGAFVVVSTPDITLENKFYPNPVMDYLHFDRDISNYQLSVFNINGELLSTNFEISSNKIDLSQLNSGIYMVNLANQDEQLNLKIIKQ